MIQNIKHAGMWFRTFFDGSSDIASTTRALGWIWSLTLCGSIIFCVLFNAFHQKDAMTRLPEIPYSYVALTGLYLAAKVGQRIWGESKPDIAPTIVTDAVKDAAEKVIVDVVKKA